MASDSEQWRVWFDRHSSALLLLARQWVFDCSAAEDVVQEAFVRFWQSRQSAKDPAAYLYGCVKHGALDWLRGRQRRTQRENAVARPEAESLFCGPAEQAERQAAISAALGELPEEQREVVVMKISGGLSFSQISEALGISPNTAASRYRYALARLREQLAEEPIT
jgi:RNA polymerase sigma-70 factor, ECF subfamily